MENNYFPPKPQMSRFELFKGTATGPRQVIETGDNPMQKAKKIQGKTSGSN
jgi:hypothetical protein